MGYAEDSTLFKDIKQNNIKSQYLLFGADTYFVNKAAHDLMKKVVSGAMQSFNLQSFNTGNTTINELETAVDALPMMAEKKCVAVKDLDLEKLSKSDFDSLVYLVSNPNPTTVLIIFLTSLDIDPKKNSRFKKIADIISKNGEVCEFKFKDKITLKKTLCDLCAKREVTLSSTLCEYLINKVGFSFAVLKNEVLKLICYVGAKNEVTKKDIDEVCITSVDCSVFDLAKNILQNNFKRAFLTMDELFNQRQEPIAILGLLNLTFTDLYRAKCAKLCQKTQSDVTTDFDYKKNREFAVANAFRDVNKYSAEHIRACILAIAHADKMLKSSKTDQKIVLEQMLGKMYMMAVKQRAI
ncbi:MAG: DNA polymerase III subunit delta [Oscillospiraceae bacterium]